MSRTASIGDQLRLTNLLLDVERVRSDVVSVHSPASQRRWSEKTVALLDYLQGRGAVGVGSGLGQSQTAVATSSRSTTARSTIDLCDGQTDELIASLTRFSDSAQLDESDLDRLESLLDDLAWRISADLRRADEDLYRSR